MSKVKNLIRKIKLSYQVYNFFNKKQLEHNLPLYQHYGIKKKYYSPISSRDFKHLESPKNVFDELDSRTELPKNDSFNSLDLATQQALLPWSEVGFVILKNFYSGEEVDEINVEVDKLIAGQKANWRYRNKIMFAIHHSDLILDCGTNPKLMNILNLLMGKKVELFQSINFITASQQKTHSDSIHMTTFPYGNLIAVWAALEDIHENNGPLHYYPGSHKLSYVMNEDFGNYSSRFFLGNKTYEDYEDKIQEIVVRENLKKQVFLAKKGDILIWHANILHGGDQLIDASSTRKSMVFHYYAKDAICFHEITERPTLRKHLR